MGAPPVLPLQKDDVELAGRVIARAFHEDELTVHLYPESDSRARFAPAMFAAFLRYDQLFGQVDHLAGCTAVASWIGPGETVETPERLAQAGFEDLPDKVPIATLDSVFGFIGPAIAKAAPEPHWHLRLLGVEPGHQGGGLGAVVMRHGIDRAADSGHPVVLETFSERAVPFYLRNGLDPGRRRRAHKQPPLLGHSTTHPSNSRTLAGHHETAGWYAPVLGNVP